MHVGAITKNGTLDNQSTGTASISLNIIRRPVVPIPPGVKKGKGKPPGTPGKPPWRTQSLFNGRGPTIAFCLLDHDIGSKLNVLRDSAESGNYLKTASDKNVPYSVELVVQDKESLGFKDSDFCDRGLLKSLSIQLASNFSHKYEDPLIGLISMMVTPE